MASSRCRWLRSKLSVCALSMSACFSATCLARSSSSLRRSARSSKRLWKSMMSCSVVRQQATVIFILMPLVSSLDTMASEAVSRESCVDIAECAVVVRDSTGIEPCRGVVSRERARVVPHSEFLSESLHAPGFTAAARAATPAISSPAFRRPMSSLAACFSLWVIAAVPEASWHRCPVVGGSAPTSWKSGSARPPPVFTSSRMK
mmetsp:Transcript_86987/g.223949  ORF Transcript_86987/g.223949 Transcript_86987/m.223949 type:complete len:204 (+) Transcript_86987:355-966(+)